MLIGQTNLVTEDNFPRLLERTNFLEKPSHYKKILILEIFLLLFIEGPLTCVCRISLLLFISFIAKKLRNFRRKYVRSMEYFEKIMFYLEIE